SCSQKRQRGQARADSRFRLDIRIRCHEGHFAFESEASIVLINAGVGPVSRIAPPKSSRALSVSPQPFGPYLEGAQALTTRKQVSEFWMLKRIPFLGQSFFVLPEIVTF